MNREMWSTVITGGAAIGAETGMPEGASHGKDVPEGTATAKAQR